ncbi:MAG: hypothetical protein K8F60_18600 [Melioribacteraceae bacterium]|nr:hypothetical protein [Melioribacteraceae bacterium]
MKKLLVLGAGVEKSKGIDMPLANELVPQIRDFLYNKEIGQNVDKALRKIIKGLRFSYDDFIKKAIDKLASEFKKEVNTIIYSVNKAKQNDKLTEEDNKLADIILNLLGKIQKLQTDVQLDEETVQLILEVFNDISISDESIVDLGRLSFSDTFEIVMKRILEKSIDEPNHNVLKHIYKNLMDIENLLLKHFIGFYNENETDIKKYLYISWTLWAYLVWKEKEVYNADPNKIPFYSKLPENIEIITFNYTSFAMKYNKESKYFHGNLSKYIRLDNRGESEIDDYNNLNIVGFIENIVNENIDFTSNRYVIPSIIPPLRLKPVLSNNFIKIWYESVKTIENSDKIIIAGYSFNYADEHFNDLIRKNKEKKITIIDPNTSNIVNNIKRIFAYSEDDYTKNTIQNKKSFEAGNLKIIEALATEIELNEL